MIGQDATVEVRSWLQTGIVNEVEPVPPDRADETGAVVVEDVGVGELLFCRGCEVPIY